MRSRQRRVRNQYRRPEQKPTKIRKPRHWRRYLSVAILIVLIIALSLIYHRLRRPGALPFKHVRIIASGTYIPQARLQSLVSANLHGGFFSLNETPIKRALSTLPWVQSVSLRRQWPDTLLVNVEEYRPFARLNGSAIVTADGTHFVPPASSIPNALVQIHCPVDQLQTTLEQFRRWQLTLLPLNVSLQAITLSQRGAWSVQLSNGTRVQVGLNDIQQRWQRFLQFYPRLIQDNPAGITQIDLRYPNGIAVATKPKH